MPAGLPGAGAGLWPGRRTRTVRTPFRRRCSGGAAVPELRGGHVAKQIMFRPTRLLPSSLAVGVTRGVADERDVTADLVAERTEPARLASRRR